MTPSRHTHDTLIGPSIQALAGATPLGPMPACTMRKGVWLTIVVNAVLFFGRATSSQAELRSLQLLQFTLAELQALEPATAHKLRDAVFSTGIFAVVQESTDRSGPFSTFSAALRSFVQCAQQGHLDEHTKTVELEDLTLRTTFATTTIKSVHNPLPESVLNDCSHFADEAHALRKTVDKTGHAYAAALDLLVHGSSSSGSFDSFALAVEKAESLEHFHLFNRPTQPAATANSASAGYKQDVSSPTAAALEMHADIGLFIVMTAAEYFDSSTLRSLEAGQGRPDAGLFVELPSGEVVRPIIPNGCLLVLNGEGASRWMRAAKGVVKPHAASHEVLLPDLLMGQTRAWFGRMFFPPNDNVLQMDGSDNVLTFGEYRQQTYASFHQNNRHLASTAGCSPTRRRIQDTGSCNSNQIYCWMSCVTLDLSLYNCSQSTIVCTDHTTGAIWPPTAGHCFTCYPTCEVSPSPPPSIAPPSSNSTPSNGSPNPSSTSSPPPSPAYLPPPPDPGTVFPPWNEQSLTMGVLLFPGYEIIDVMGPLEFLSFMGFAQFSFVTRDGYRVSAQIPPVMTSVATFGHYSYRNAPRFDIFFIPGGTGVDAIVNDTKTLNYVRKASAQSNFTWSVCTGSHILANAGVLDGMKATSNKFAWEDTAKYGPKVNWQPSARWVVDHKFWTGSGVTAGMDMTLGFIHAYFGPDLAEMVYLLAEYTPNLDPHNDPYAIGGPINQMIRRKFGVGKHRRHRLSKA